MWFNQPQALYPPFIPSCFPVILPCYPFGDQVLPPSPVSRLHTDPLVPDCSGVCCLFQRLLNANPSSVSDLSIFCDQALLHQNPDLSLPQRVAILWFWPPPVSASCCDVCCNACPHICDTPHSTITYRVQVLKCSFLLNQIRNTSPASPSGSHMGSLVSHTTHYQ